MSELRFSVEETRALERVASPAIAMRLHVANTGDPIEAMVLRVQLRIEPQWRRFDAREELLLEDLFGTPDRWEKTLHSISWADLPLMVPAFVSETDAELRVPCSFDFDQASTRYLSVIEDGDVLVRLFFSGSVFRRASAGFSQELVPWSCECAVRLPATRWREAMRACYGDSVLIRVDRETFDALHRVRASTGSVTWEQTFKHLLGPPVVSCHPEVVSCHPEVSKDG